MVSDNNNKTSNIGSVYITVNAASHAVPISTYENRTYGVYMQFPSNWTLQGSNDSGDLINVATFVSPTGPASNPTADVAIYVNSLHNSTTNLNNYAHFVAFTDYENRISYFHSFKLLELNTNSSILGRSAYILIGSYQDPSAGLQKLSEIGTMVGDKAYSIQYIADASSYSELLPTVQKMIQSFRVTTSKAPISHYNNSRTSDTSNNMT